MSIAHPPDTSWELIYINTSIDAYFGTIVASYKKDTAVFNIPGLGNFIQDFVKNCTQSNLNLNTF